jgi:hypothetical protein
LPHRSMHRLLDPGAASADPNPFLDDHAFAPCNQAMPKRRAAINAKYLL